MVSIGGFSESAFTRPTKRTHEDLTTDNSNQCSVEEQRVQSSTSSHTSPGMHSDSGALGRGTLVDGAPAGENPGAVQVSISTGQSLLTAAPSTEVQSRFPISDYNHGPRDSQAWRLQLDEVKDSPFAHVPDLLHLNPQSTLNGDPNDMAESTFLQQLTGQPAFDFNWSGSALNSSSMGSSYRGGSNAVSRLI